MNLKELYEYAAAEYGDKTAFRYKADKKEVYVSFNKFTGPPTKKTEQIVFA